MVKIFITIFLTLLIEPLFAQETGSPFSRNYPAREYNAHSQNWDIVQDQRGVMYFGNNNGVLEYDGVKWNLIPVKRDVLSLAIDKAGRVYAGAIGEIGYLQPNPGGQLSYVSLLDQLQPQDRNFEHIWKTHAADHGVYFQSFQSLIRWGNGKMKVWYPSARADGEPGSFHFSFLIENHLFIRQDGRGLLELKGDSLQLAPGGEQFADEKIYVMVPFSKERILIGTLSKGFFIYNVNTGALVPFSTEADRFCLENQIYHGIRLANGNFAIATITGGVVILDKVGKVVQFINKQAFLQNEGVHYIYNDPHNNLWMALDNGISNAEINSPWQQWNESHGLKGSVYSVVRHEGTLYAGTAQGAFYLENNHFYPVEGIRGQTWNWLAIPAGNNNRRSKLLAANSAGIYEITGRRARLLFKGNAAFVFFRSLHYPTRIYAGFDNGLAALSLRGDSLRYEGKLPEIQGEIRNIVEDDDGNIVLNIRFQGIIIVRPSEESQPFKALEIVRLDAFPGLDLPQNKLYTLNNNLVLAKDQKMYRFNKEKGDFEQDTLLGKLLKEGDVTLLKQDENENIWVTLNSYKLDRDVIQVLRKQPNGFYQREETSFRRLPEMVVQVIYPEANGVSWIGGSEGLFRYDMRVSYNYQQTYRTLIRSVNLGEDSLVFAGTYFKYAEGQPGSRITSLEQSQEQQPDFKYGNNSITFQYAAPYFKDENANEYSYFLEGFDKTWSAWSSEHKKQYTNLSEGEYTFRVKAKNIYGVESQPATYRFTVLPPWYRTRWAYLAYVASLALFVWAVVKMNTRRLVEEKYRLEDMVKERTLEITSKNAELLVKSEDLKHLNEVIMAKNHTLELHKTEIEKKNHDITASLNYAQRIQSVTLPQIDKIKEVYPESFILFKPRDIVSGDFYWFSKLGSQTVITGVDCTGHGVPGAFMSLIGNNLLNEIINMRGITVPGEILRELHIGVRTILKQDETKNRDGMDMSLCVIDEEKKLLYFAGAKNPLIYIHNNELFELKGDKQPIGGLWHDEGGVVQFNTQMVELKDTMTFYITSDGYEDQFGGPKGKKFMKKQLKELFLSIHEQPMEAQKQVLEDTLREWMGNQSQIDDILVMGFRIRIAN